MSSSYATVLSSALAERYRSWLKDGYAKDFEHFKLHNFGKELKAIATKGMDERPEGNKFTAGGVTCQ
eukprot:330947-Rhodomonas_salina.1